MARYKGAEVEILDRETHRGTEVLKISGDGLIAPDGGNTGWVDAVDVEE